MGFLAPLGGFFKSPLGLSLLFGAGSGAGQALLTPDSPEPVEPDPLRVNLGGLDLGAPEIAGETYGRMMEFAGPLTDRAFEPIEFPGAYVQQPPIFTGGGLPMPIGLTGRDPALDDPSLLGIPALGQSRLRRPPG